MKRWDTLPGLQRAPVLPAATAAIDRLRSVFRQWAYTEARFDVLQPAENLDLSGFACRHAFTETSGESVALRPDFTSLVAREAATVEREMPRPLRRSYAGEVFRRPERADDRRREILQAGAELIGAASRYADAEIVNVAVEGLVALGIETAQIHLGHVGFVRSLLRSAKLAAPAEATICGLLARHERSNLETFLRTTPVSRDTADALLSLLDLSGDVGVIDRARSLTGIAEAHAALDELEDLLSLLERSVSPSRPAVVLDLAEVRERSYYTGMRFEAFAPGLGYPILRGGRYDDLVGTFGSGEPAVGCAFEIDRIASLGLPADNAPGRVLLRFRSDRWDEARETAQRLRGAGRSVVLDPDEIDAEHLDAYLESCAITEIIDLTEARQAGREGDRT